MFIQSPVIIHFVEVVLYQHFAFAVRSVYIVLPPNQRDSYKEKRETRRGDVEKMRKLSDADKTKLKDLREEYQIQKDAVEKSRIAPEMQKQKLQVLKENYEKNKKELLDSVK